jgi:hypothetical protein
MRRTHNLYNIERLEALHTYGLRCLDGVQFQRVNISWSAWDNSRSGGTKGAKHSETLGHEDEHSTHQLELEVVPIRVSGV